MTIRVGINGFGRMGRLGFRAGWKHNSYDVVQINETATDATASAHLLKYDSVHGIWGFDPSAIEQEMHIDNQLITHSSSENINDSDWSNCDIVIEATGKHHKKPERLQQYFDQGVKKVIVAAPTEGALNLVYGINHHLYDPKQHQILTAASCTTNCLAPIVKVMHEKIGIKHGCMTTIHDITNTQTIVDKGHKDLRRRPCLWSIINSPQQQDLLKQLPKYFPS